MRRKMMFGSTQKWWGVAALALLCMVPCTFANTALTVTGAGDKTEGFCVGPYYATGHDRANTPVVCDDFANQIHEGSSWNYSSHNFSSVGSALWGDHEQNSARNGLNSWDVKNWPGTMSSNSTGGKFSHATILTPEACPIGLNSCRVSAPEGGSEATYLMMAALSCFAAMLLRRRKQTVALRSSIA
jgi:hypothetical protein